MIRIEFGVLGYCRNRVRGCYWSLFVLYVYFSNCKINGSSCFNVVGLVVIGENVFFMYCSIMCWCGFGVIIVIMVICG